MSFSGFLESTIPGERHRFADGFAVLRTLPLAALLIRGGGLVVCGSVLMGLVLAQAQRLTVFFIEVVPLAIMIGLASVCLGTLLLCLRALRDLPKDPVCQTAEGYRSSLRS